jgi:hypothetical protein
MIPDPEIPAATPARRRDRSDPIKGFIRQRWPVGKLANPQRQTEDNFVSSGQSPVMRWTLLVYRGRT